MQSVGSGSCGALQRWVASTTPALARCSAEGREGSSERLSGHRSSEGALIHSSPTLSAFPPSAQTLLFLTFLPSWSVQTSDDENQERARDNFISI